MAAGVLDRCSVVFLNMDNPHGWFVDPTPQQDEEFEPVTVELCGEPRTVLKAKRGGPAAGKQDLYTVVLHEFGHALGLVHTGGCDRNPFTGHPQDDDGAVMWEGFLTQRRDLEDSSRGLGHDLGGERVHLNEGDLWLLQALYLPASPGFKTRFPSGGRTPKGIAVGSLLVANNESNTVARLDPRTGRLQALFPVGTFPVDVVVDRERQRAYVADFGSDDVTVLDLGAGRVAGRFRVGRQPAALALDPRSQRLYVALFGEGAIAAFDLDVSGPQPRRVGTIRVPKPLDVAVAPEGRVGYAVAQLEVAQVCLPTGCFTQETGGVVTLDLARFEAIHTLRVEGAALRQLALSPDGRRLFVSGRPSRGGQGGVLALEADPVARRIVGEVPVGRRPYGLAVSPDGCFLVVANIDSHDVSILDPQKLRVLQTLRDPLARGPFGVAVWGSKAYVTNHLSHTVSVFELGACPSP